MKIRKFEGRAEKDVIEQVKQELGLDALILNIKTTKPKGVFAFMRKPSVEVTAAYDDKKDEKKRRPPSLARPISEAPPKPVPDASRAQGVPPPKAWGEEPTPQEVAQKLETVLAMAAGQDIAAAPPRLSPPAAPAAASKRQAVEAEAKKEKERIRLLEAELRSTESLLEATLKKLAVAQHSRASVPRRYDNNVLQVFYTTLVEQGVREDIAVELLEDIPDLEQYEEADIGAVVGVVYARIIKMLQRADSIDMEAASTGKPAVITFIGPTGVGKTTTIAKLSSLFILRQGKKVGLITADTYRIAAVEQLKTYSEILSVPIITAYNKQDIAEAVKKLSRECEVIIIDTAGRSHKHKENIEELRELLSSVNDSNKYLALSTTTKSEDILSIIELYSQVTSFDLVFTKLDETTSLGSILNACHLMGCKAAYITNGQSVPEDIEPMQPEKIAKALLGLGGF